MRSFIKQNIPFLRICLGIYLVVHFSQLFSDSIELFSNVGMISNTSNIPNISIFKYYDEPIFVNLFIISLIVASLSFVFNYKSKICQIYIFFGWMSLINRNPLIVNPTINYIGWLLLSFSFSNTKKNENTIIYYGFWLIVGLSYTASGIHKLQCETWRNGTALFYILSGPLSRQNILTDFILTSPLLIKTLTYSSLFLEISSLFIGIFYRCRKWYWLSFTLFHIGILLCINFSDLSIGMIVIHLFNFDLNWLSPLIPVFQFDDKIKNIRHYFESIIYIIPIIPIIWMLQSIQINAVSGFGAIIIIFLVFYFLENIFPDQKLEYVKGWWIAVILINIFQLLCVIIATFTWEKWLMNSSSNSFKLQNYVNPFWGAIISYFINQWLFYFWHLARHEVYAFWLLFHQFHHSPSRIETITSFYKHPFEIIIDSIIMSVLVYKVLGLTPESSIWLSIFSATGEFFYHMNIKTPYFIGYFFQRPESHRIHHAYMRRFTKNYSDFPLWDILGATFDNPEKMTSKTGFTENAEQNRWEMISFKDVIFVGKSIKNIDIKKCLLWLLVIWGCLNSFAFICHIDSFKEIGFVTTSSPLPLVFSSYNGFETYSTDFHIKITYQNSSCNNVFLDTKRYNKLTGSYARRNAYGVLFSHGIFFIDPKLISLRDNILKQAICNSNSIIKEFEIDNKNISNVKIQVLDKTHDNKLLGSLTIYC